MSAPDPDDEPSALRRLIRDGGRVRPLSDGERAALFVRMKQRMEKPAPQPALRRLVAAGVACTALVGLTLFNTDSGKAPSDPPKTAGSTPSASAPVRSPADAGMASVKDAVRRVSLAGRGEIVLDTQAIARLPAKIETRRSAISVDAGSGVEETASFL